VIVGAADHHFPARSRPSALALDEKIDGAFCSVWRYLREICRDNYEGSLGHADFRYRETTLLRLIAASLPFAPVSAGQTQVGEISPNLATDATADYQKRMEVVCVKFCKKEVR
jgi:hypothetical protein